MLVTRKTQKILSNGGEGLFPFIQTRQKQAKLQLVACIYFWEYNKKIWKYILFSCMVSRLQPYEPRTIDVIYGKNVAQRTSSFKNCNTSVSYLFEIVVSVHFTKRMNQGYKMKLRFLFPFSLQCRFISTWNCYIIVNIFLFLVFVLYRLLYYRELLYYRAPCVRRRNQNNAVRKMWEKAYTRANIFPPN